MRVGIVGGGINGLGIAWELARKDYQVTLFEKGVCGAQTSSKTTKMIHGGLRYLEHLHLDLVRESLRERAWLLEHLPQLVHPMEVVLPIYEDSPRRPLTLRTGLILYDLLSGRRSLARHQKYSPDELLARIPLRREGLVTGFAYHDAQVDDFALARCVMASAQSEGADIRESSPVVGLRRQGKEWVVRTVAGETPVDLLINAAGPWMNELLGENDLRSRYRLSLVRGAHLVLRAQVAKPGVLLQSIDDRRVLFVLPWKGTTLVGTTEVRHHGSLDDVQASDEEIEYLIDRYNRYLRDPIDRSDVASTFAGVRPLAGRAANPSAIGREYRVTRQGNLINVFGGKMTTFRSLAAKVGMRADIYFGRPRPAREPRFAC